MKPFELEVPNQFLSRTKYESGCSSLWPVSHTVVVHKEVKMMAEVGCIRKQSGYLVFSFNNLEFITTGKESIAVIRYWCKHLTVALLGSQLIILLIQRKGLLGTLKLV